MIFFFTLNLHVPKMFLFYFQLNPKWILSLLCFTLLSFLCNLTTLTKPMRKKKSLLKASQTNVTSPNSIKLCQPVRFYRSHTLRRIIRDMFDEGHSD